MLFENKASRYPNLVAFLRESAEEEKQINREEVERWWTVGGILAGLGAAVAGSPLLVWLHVLPSSPPLDHLGIYPVILVAGAGAGLLGARRMISKQRAALDTPERRQRIEAFKTVGSMRQMLEHNRLHRDLSESTLVVLEETARYRGEIRALLQSTFWMRHDLPDNYQRLKEQAIKAADQAMLDAICVYRAHVPENVAQRNLLDYVDEAVETLVFSNRRHTRFAEPGFDGVFDIARKLQLLSDELQKTTHQAELDMEIPRQVIPGGLVDLTMTELRNLREAQEELRQDLRG